MRWNNDPNGSGYRIRQFDTPTQGSMRNLALEELTAPKRQHSRRSLRLILPAWLTRRAVRDAEQTTENTKQTERID